MFGHCRESVRSVFECGVGTILPGAPITFDTPGTPGASLRVWREYFPNARICGADVNREVLFQDHRISTHYLDQTSPASIAALWHGIEATEFGLMIDDGPHTFEAGLCLFEHAFFMLGKNGIYVIDDVTLPSMMKFATYFNTKSYNVEFVNLHRPNQALADNALIVIRN